MHYAFVNCFVKTAVRAFEVVNTNRDDCNEAVVTQDAPSPTSCMRFALGFLRLKVDQFPHYPYLALKYILLDTISRIKAGVSLVPLSILGIGAGESLVLLNSSINLSSL